MSRDAEPPIRRSLAGRRRLHTIVTHQRTASTQDAARDEPVGTVVMACDQTAGRGRAGRAWSAGRGNLAVTIVLDVATSTRRAIGIAVVVAEVLETMIGRRVDIKWPNDVLVDGRKIAGVLIEQTDRALIGIGINVRQLAWPDHLALIACSLAEHGVDVAPEAVLDSLLPKIDVMDDRSPADLRQAFAERDVLSGAQAVVRSAGITYAGVIRVIDPFEDLTLVTTEGTVHHLSAATTTVIEAERVLRR